MEIKTVDTDSILFKAYAAQLSRTERFMWRLERVLERETNICDFGYRVWLQFWYRFFASVLVVLAGVVGGLCVIAPVMTVLLWVVTDNGLIPFMGEFGVMIMGLEAVFLFFGIAMYGIYLLSLLFKKSATITPVSLAATWIENKRGKYCSKIVFNKVPDNDSP